MKHFIVLFTLITTSFTSFSQKNIIELRLEKGKDYQHTIDSKIELFEKKAGKTTKLNMVISGSLVYHVDKIKKDEMLLKTKYERLRIEFRTNSAEMVYDSENPGDEIVGRIYAEMKKVPFEITMSKQGKIIKIEGEEKIFEQALSIFPELSEDQRQTIKNQLAESLGEDAFRGNFELITAVYPNVPVEIGDKWQTKSVLTSEKLKQDISNEFTLMEVKPEYVIIEGNSELLPVIDASKKDQILLKGTMTTYLRLDPKTNWMISSKVVQVMKGHYAKFKDDDKDNYIIFKTETSYSGSVSN